jgi:hypothetical protein
MVEIMEESTGFKLINTEHQSIWKSKASRELAELFKQIRKYRHFVISNVPSFNLDKDDYAFLEEFKVKEGISEGYGNMLLLARFLNEYKIRKGVK